jgi:mycoredoxin
MQSNSESITLTLLGATDCDDTQRVRDHLNRLGILFSEINIDDDSDAEQFVIYINGGFRSTPTLIVSAGKLKSILTEPTNGELEAVLKAAGYQL